MRPKLNRGDAFQLGEVWQTTHGTLYLVTGFELKGGMKMAVLRQGADGSGRKKLRPWDAVLIGWTLYDYPGKAS